MRMPQIITHVPATGPIAVSAFEMGVGIRHFFGTRRYPADPKDPFHESLPGRKERADVPHAVVSVKQVHGHNALIVDKPVEAGTTFEGGWDAVITDQPGVMATVRTADCVPVLLHDPIRRVVAAIHSGWRGSMAQIVPRTLQTMGQVFGSSAASIHVAVGPSAGVCCYEVDDPVLRPLREFSFWPSVVRETGPGRAFLDLRALIQAQTVAAGVHEDHIWIVDLCTICRPQMFHSYRREGMAKQTMTSGIMLSVGR